MSGDYYRCRSYRCLTIEQIIIIISDKIFFDYIQFKKILNFILYETPKLKQNIQMTASLTNKTCRFT